VLQAVKTSPLEWQCQQALNDISTWHAVRLYWVPRHARVTGNEIADKLARDDSVERFDGCELGIAI
jgi:ribonuclease HI